MTAQTLLVAIIEEFPSKAVQSHFSKQIYTRLTPKQIYTSLTPAHNILPLHFNTVFSESIFSSLRYPGMIAL